MTKSLNLLSSMNSPAGTQRIHLFFTWFWVVMIPISVITGWIHSVTYVSALSLWALVSSHWSAWQAARTEVRQELQEQRDTAQEVTDRLVEQTELGPAD